MDDQLKSDDPPNTSLQILTMKSKAYTAARISIHFGYNIVAYTVVVNDESKEQLNVQYGGDPEGLLTDTLTRILIKANVLNT